MPLESGLGEAGDLGRGERRGGLADELRRLPPAAAEGERDVVPLDAGEAGDVVRGRGRDLERIGRGVVEGVAGGV
jgi:hypothetical protein